MAPIHRVLIKTHHMTSTKKIQVITKAAKSLSCSVILKTGGWPGIMLAEGERVGEWMEVVRVSCLIIYSRESDIDEILQKLRYKDYLLLRKGVVERPRLNIEPGTVNVKTSMKGLVAFLEREPELYEWWRNHMGYKKGNDAP
jgi:hypothetical protein